ncbi:phosphatase PAP2 family protein [Ottowia sp. VDI28]|uniref:phosphatase PAP2 family protein n=1 Tax=Ottowia sp. VDI28 TaxID=3133968 RepID=UPI003C30DF02
MSAFPGSLMPAAFAAQGLSILDPFVPWLLAAVLLAAGGLAWRGRRALAVAAPWRLAARLSWAAAGGLMLGAALLFWGMAWGVMAGQESAFGQWIAGWDGAALLWARREPLHGLRALALALTDIGSARVLMPLVVLVSLWLLYRRQRFLAAAWFIGCTANSLLLRMLKNVFERTRPVHAAEVMASGYSFPSGHAAGMAMVIGLLVWLLRDQVAGPWRAPLVLLGILLIAAVAASRVLLQAHFLSDVLAGLLLGAFSLLLTIAVIEHART